MDTHAYKHYLLYPEVLPFDLTDRLETCQHYNKLPLSLQEKRERRQEQTEKSEQQRRKGHNPT
jgi:hypothetical protein